MISRLCGGTKFAQGRSGGEWAHCSNSKGQTPGWPQCFYRAVVQAILLYGLETWILLVAMENKVEGAHTGFLRLIMGNQVWRIGDGTWETPGTEVVR